MLVNLGRYANRAGSIPGHKKTPMRVCFFGGLGRNVHIAHWATVAERNLTHHSR